MKKKTRNGNESFEFVCCCIFGKPCAVGEKADDGTISWEKSIKIILKLNYHACVVRSLLVLPGVDDKELEQCSKSMLRTTDRSLATIPWLFA